MWGCVHRGQPAPRWENGPEMARDVPVRYVLDGAGPGLAPSPEQAEQKEEP